MNHSFKPQWGLKSLIKAMIINHKLPKLIRVTRFDLFAVYAVLAPFEKVFHAKSVLDK